MAIRFVIVILIIGLVGVYSAGLRATQAVTEAMPLLDQLPREIGDWRSDDVPVNEVEAKVLAADTTLHRRFRRPDGTVVWLFVAYFAQQQVNSQIHSPRNCIPGGGWNVRSIDEAVLPLAEGSQPVTRMIIEKDGHSLEAVYWFRTRSGTVAGEYALKLDLVKNSIARRPTDAVFIRYSADGSDPSALREVISLLDAPLNRILGEVGLP